MADEANQIQIGLEKKERNETTFNELAHADAKHDFDKIKVRNILEKLEYPLNSKISSPQYVLNKTKTRKSDGDKNIYEFFKAYLNTVLPTKEAPKGSILKEEEVMEKIGLDYSSEIRIPLNNIGVDEKGVVPLGDNDDKGKRTKKKEFTFKDEDGNPIKRIYEVTAVRYRIGKTERIPVAQAFEAVSGGKKEFNLIVDAANISTSDLRIFNKPAVKDKRLVKDGDETINPMEGQTDGPFTFRFLKSIENDSDSATKIENFEKVPDPSDENKVKVYFLKDENNVGYFPSFQDPNPAANVFSGVQFETRRIGEKVLGSFQVETETNKNYEIDDLSKSSERNEASKLAMDKYIENITGIDRNNKIQKEIALHILSKRIGDWCQAICLLDKAREYTFSELIFEPTGKYKEVKKVIEETKGDGSKEKKDKKVKLIDFPEAETALVTLDQILLAYSILLGVNVFFTINTVNPAPGGAGWLIYFKNTLSGGVTEDQITDTKKGLGEALVKLTEYIEGDHKNIVEAIKAKIAKSSEKPTLLEYLKEIYTILYGLTELTPKEEFESLKTQIEPLLSKEPTEKDVDWYVSSKFIKNKAEQLIADNENQLSLTMPENLEQSITAVLDHVKNQKSLACTTVFMRFIEEIIKPFRERYLIIDSEYGGDITNLFVPIEKYDESFIGISASDRVANKQNNMREIRIKVNSIFDGKKILKGGAIRKSDREEYKKQLEESFNKIRQRRIIFANTKGNFNKLLEKYEVIDNEKKEGYEAQIKKIENKIEKIPVGDYFIGLKGDYVQDRHGNYISIIDQYIVTPDDCDIFITGTGQICEILAKLFTSEYKEGYENLILGVNNRVLSSPTHKHTETAREKSMDFFKEKYLNLRWKLLFTDILYTRIKNIENRISTILDDLRYDYEESKKYQNVGETYEDILKIANDDQDLFLEKNYSDLFNEMKVILEYLNKITGDFNRNKNKVYIKLTNVLSRKKKTEKKETKIKKLLRFISIIRNGIIYEYYNAAVVMFDKGQKRSYNYKGALLYIENQEASKYLASFEEKDKKEILDDNEEEKEAQKKLIDELNEVFVSDNSTGTAAAAATASAEGGSRKKRKTRRKSQRIKTTRRKRKNKV